MITTKKLIACWIVLGIALLAGNMVHDVLMKEALVIAAKEAPPYVPVSDVEAVRLEYEACKREASYEIELLKVGSSCEDYFSLPVEQIAKNLQRGHRSLYEAGEVTPRVNARQSEIDENLKKFYYGLIIAAFAAFLFWCKSTVLPRLVAMKDAVRVRAPSTSDLKALGASRKVRQAESDFVTLKNLHDNGLIDDEMFEKRKKELKVSLSNNQIFKA